VSHPAAGHRRAVSPGIAGPVTITDGATAPGKQAVGSQPFGLAINPRTNTVYVTQLFQAGSLSIFRAAG